MVSSYQDKRVFPRYIVNLDSEVIIAGEEVKARIVDFSIGGVSLIVDEIPDVDPEGFEIKIKELDIHTKARVAWKREGFSLKRLSLQNIGSIKGSLPLYKISDFVIGLHRMGKTGILEIEADPYKKKIYFKEGEVVFSASNQESERMGDMLVEIGKITPDQYDEAADLMMKKGNRHGAALVELGYLTPEVLVWAVRYQVERIIQNLFSLRDGNVIFKEEPYPINEVITLKMSIGNLIYRGIKSIKDFEIIKQNCPPFDTALRFSSKPMDLFQDIELDEEDKAILKLIEGERTISDLISMSHLEEEETLKTIYGLYSTRMVHVQKDMIAPTVVKGIIEQYEPETESITRDEIERLYKEHKMLGYYGILNIRSNASVDEIGRAYSWMSKKYHPDRHLQFQSDEVKEKLNTIFEYINEAYSELMNLEEVVGVFTEPGEPLAEDQEQAVGAFTEPAEPLTEDQEEVVEAVTEPGEPPMEDQEIAFEAFTEPAEALTEDQKQVVGAVTEPGEPLMEDQDIAFEAFTEPGELLTEDQEQVIGAATEPGEPRTEDQEEVVEAVTEPEERPAEDDEKKTARKKFEEGRQFLDNQNHEQAIILLEEAVRLNDSVPEYHFYYGLSLFKDTRLKDSEESIRKALQLDPDNAEYTAQLGKIYVRLGLKTKAKNTFEKALTYDPSNATAQEGLSMLST